MEMLSVFYSKYKKRILITSLVIWLFFLVMPFINTHRVELKSSYMNKEDVALYLMQYHELPPNYITKDGAGYMERHDISGEGMVVGGDTHINTGQFSEFGLSGSERLRECDIISPGYEVFGKRGTYRLVYTCNTENVRVFYTEDHYETYIELTYSSLQGARNAFMAVLGIYSVVCGAFWIYVIKEEKWYLRFMPRV